VFFVCDVLFWVCVVAVLAGGVAGVFGVYDDFVE